ncbi:unnamed protein product [Urochloa humidicola]
MSGWAPFDRWFSLLPFTPTLSSTSFLSPSLLQPNAQGDTAGRPPGRGAEQKRRSAVRRGARRVRRGGETAVRPSGRGVAEDRRPATRRGARPVRRGGETAGRPSGRGAAEEHRPAVRTAARSWARSRTLRHEVDLGAVIGGPRRTTAACPARRLPVLRRRSAPRRPPGLVPAASHADARELPAVPAMDGRSRSSPSPSPSPTMDGPAALA